MKRLILLLMIGYCSLQSMAQEKGIIHSIHLSLIRLESNSQTFHGKFELKFVSGVEYQRFLNNWNFGIKYEHGFNKIEEYWTDCYDCLYGTGYMREDNFYLSTNYSILNLLNSRLKLNTGLSFYYSNLNFSGEFQGGFSGNGARENTTYNTIGFTPNVSITYYPMQRFFVSLNSNIRYGWSTAFDNNSNQERKVREFVITAPELKIGVIF